MIHDRFPTAQELGMKGYWILRHGSLSVTFYVPSRWERFCAWFSGESWIAYDWVTDATASKRVSPR